MTINFKQFQCGDILDVTGPDLLGDGIRFGSKRFDDLQDGKSRFDADVDAIEHIFDKDIPTHSLMVRDTSGKYGINYPIEGAEMQWPKSQYTDLTQYTDNRNSHHIVAAFRCPYLDDNKFPDISVGLRQTVRQWLDSHIGSSYGADNFLAFLGLKPEDTKNIVCSMWSTLAIIECVDKIGYKCNFPANWYASDTKDNKTVGLVSPFEQYEVLSKLGWGIYSNIGD